MRIIQIIGLIIGLYLLYNSYRSFKGKKEDINSFVLWTVLGVSITIISIDLRTLEVISNLLRMEQRAYTIFTISNLLLFVMVFKLYARIKDLEENISILNEEVSISNYEEQKE